MVTEARKLKIKQVLERKQPDLTVVFENIHDPHNVSAILRTCDAVGILETYLLYTHTAFPKLGKKSSASAKKWIVQHRFTNYQRLKSELKNKGMKIYATYLDPEARSIFDIDWTEPAALIMGNEHLGVSDEALQIADEKIYIPQNGFIQSLNVSVASAVILYEAFRQRFLAGFYSKRRLSEAVYHELFHKWSSNLKDG